MSRFVNFLYNIDRAMASLLGFPPQETLSSEVGRKAKSADPDGTQLIAKVLDKIQKDHVEVAIQHADRLDIADDGFEQ